MIVTSSGDTVASRSLPKSFVTAKRNVQTAVVRLQCPVGKENAGMHSLGVPAGITTLLHDQQLSLADAGGRLLCGDAPTNIYMQYSIYSPTFPISLQHAVLGLSDLHLPG